MPSRMRKLRPLSPALVISVIALFVSLGGGAIAYASGLIPGSQIKNHSIPAKKLTTKAIKSLHGQRGARGPAGPSGPAGATGRRQGPVGPTGPGAERDNRRLRRHGQRVAHDQDARYVSR